MDYSSTINTIVQFNECEQRSCINITIVDDEVLENIEYFNLTLERNGLHERIQLDPVDGIVEITDNDGMSPACYTHTVKVQLCSISFLQQLWWVWRRHSTECLKEWVLWKSVLLFTIQTGTLHVPLTLPLMLISQLVTAVQVTAI